MNNMMRDFGDPFGMGHRALNAPDEFRGREGGHQRHPQRHPQRQTQDLMPHSHLMGGMMDPMNMFSQMDSMFRNMHSNMEMMASDPNSYSYSSSSVMTYSNDGRGEPQYYQASSAERRGPGGVRETQKSVRDSQSGVEKMALGQHIGDRGHEYQRSRNRRTGEEEEVRNFVNMDEEDASHFNRQWRDATRQHNTAIGYQGHRNERHNGKHKSHRSRAIKGHDKA
eukprot:gene6691-12248_t